MPSYFTQSISILFKTFPYLLLRMLLYFLFGILFLIYAIVVYFIGKSFTSLHPNAPFLIWGIGLLISFPISRLVREYFLYVLKAGHIAVIVHLAFKGALPDGIGQIEWGKAEVMKRFQETSVLFLIDRLVNGVISAINRMMYRIGNIFSSVPGMQGLVRLGQTILRFSLTYLDESILARSFLFESESVWESAKSGLILYAQSWQKILKTAFFLGRLSLVSYGIMVVLFLIPAFMLGKIYPTFQWISILAAFVFAGIFKLALFHPFAMTYMILVYLKETKEKIPDPHWETKLEELSKKFRIIQQKTLPMN